MLNPAQQAQETARANHRRNQQFMQQAAQAARTAQQQQQQRQFAETQRAFQKRRDNFKKSRMQPQDSQQIDRGSGRAGGKVLFFLIVLFIVGFIALKILAHR